MSLRRISSWLDKAHQIKMSHSNVSTFVEGFKLMKLTLNKKVEIYVGYQGFYTCGREKITITVEENGVGAP